PASGAGTRHQALGAASSVRPLRPRRPGAAGQRGAAVRDNRRTRLILGVLLIVAIVLITLDFRDGGASPTRRVGADIFGPVERITHDVTNPVARAFDSITGGPSAQSTIATLQQENAELRAELSSAQLSEAAKKQLAQLLQLDAGGYRIVTASVIAAGGDFSNTVTLDAGSKDGIRPNETVLNGSGFVGTVTQVSADTSTVLLANDASSVVGVQMAGGGIGDVTGLGKSMSGSTLLRLSLFDANAVLRPYVNFTALGVVGVVVQVPRNNLRASVLPHPAPTVTITVTPSPSSTQSPANSTTSPAASASASATGGG